MQNRAYDNLRIEIQLRTRLQHTWATAVEAVGIFTKEALKSNIGNKDWLRLFALMSSQIAVREKSNRIPATPEDEKDRLAEIIHLEGKLRAIATLDAYRATIVWAKEKVEKWSYFIMEYDYKQNNIKVQNFPKGQSQLANQTYTQMESTTRDASKNIVLVAVDSINALERAYPNYFLDTQQFSDLLRECVTHP